MPDKYFEDSSVILYHGDALAVLSTLPDASVDAVVTDPPYGLEFMGKEWDAPWTEKGINSDAAFTSVEMSDGFKRLPRPSFTGSTNPTCLNCKGRQRGRRDGTALVPTCVCEAPRFPNVRAVEMRAFQAWCTGWAAECLRVLKPGGHLLAFGGTRTWHRLTVAVEDAGFEIRDSIAWLYGSGFPKSLNLVDDEGERSGWGTALKPAHEPIIMARKPLVGTVAANVSAHGTGALNVDGCRILTTDALGGGQNTGNVKAAHEGWNRPWMDDPRALAAAAARSVVATSKAETLGRWPANVALDESQAAALDEQSGLLTSGANPTRRGSDKFRDTYGEFTGQEVCRPARGVDAGGASRFFYVAKADSAERVRVNGIAHPTVKPLALMRWLVRLVTPPGGTVLEPFAGSGTTVEACVLEGFGCVAVEREGEYLPLIRQRIDRRRDPVAAVKAITEDSGLFDLLDGETA